MKKMTIEEKAKAYDEALAHAKLLLKTIGNATLGNLVLKNEFENIFPELKESEDERIRKKVIYVLKLNVRGAESQMQASRGVDRTFEVYACNKVIAWLEKQGENISLPKFTFDDVLALQCAMEAAKKVQKDKDLYEQLKSLHDRLHDAYWLEKQGEQKLLVIPKFRKGDLIRYKTNPDDVERVDSIMDDHYILDIKGECTHVLFSCQDLWELVEQKPAMIQWKGDNLKEVINFTGKDKNFDKWFKSFEEYEKYVHEHNDIFKLFNEDGSHYEIPVGAWIVKTPDGYNVASKAILVQKPAWSEEDESMLYGVMETEQYMLDVVNGIKKFDVGNASIKEDCTRELNWLKSIKDRVQPQPKQEWSEEDEATLIEITKLLKNPALYEACPNLREESADWLKSLRPHSYNISDEELVQAKKDAFNSALDKIEYHSGEPTFDDGWSAAIDFIRKKSLRSQNRWKPSEEQVKILNEVLNFAANHESPYWNDYIFGTLNNLIRQLKKLKE